MTIWTKSFRLLYLTASSDASSTRSLLATDSKAQHTNELEISYGTDSCFFARVTPPPFQVDCCVVEVIFILVVLVVFILVVILVLVILLVLLMLIVLLILAIFARLVVV